MCEIGVPHSVGKYLWNLFFLLSYEQKASVIALSLSVRLLLANICLTWQRCGNFKITTFLGVLWKCWVDGKGPNQCPHWKLLISRDRSRLSCYLSWLTCVKWVALNHPGLFVEIPQGVRGRAVVVVKRFWGQRPQNHRQPAAGPFCCSWKQSFLNRQENSFAVYWKVLSHCLCFAAHLFGVFFHFFPPAFHPRSCSKLGALFPHSLP